MSSYNDEFFGTDNDSDSDAGFEEDMEALRRACRSLNGPTESIDDDLPQSSTAAGTVSDVDGGDGDGDADADDLAYDFIVDDLRQSSTAAGTVNEGGDGYGDGDDPGYESEDDDLELVRNIQRRFSAAANTTDVSIEKQPSLAGILPPAGLSDENDDFQDDLETLRAIQHRFSQYNSQDSSLLPTEQVSTNFIDSGRESWNNFFVEGNAIDVHRFPDCADGRGATMNLDFPSSDISQWASDSRFPISAQALVDAIKKNRSCQKKIRSKLIQIEARMEENKKLRERVKILKDFQLACRKRTGRALSQKKDARIQLISVPKLRANTKVREGRLHPMYHGPAENSHVLNYREVMSKYPSSLRREPWSKEERENLVKGIKQQFQEMLMQNVFSTEGADLNSLDSLIVQVRDHEITPEEIREFLPRVNWELLSSMYVKRRSGAECQARWLSCEDPLINRQPWTKEEEKKLLYILKELETRNWFAVAEMLGTSRTSFQCLVRFQRSLNPSILKRDWTPSEDEDLNSAVAEYGEGNWQLVASAMEGRTGTQCSNRWKKSLNPIREKVGRFNQEEDKRLKIAVMFFGAKNWNKIARFVHGRTQVQCRERWSNSLDPSLNLSEWTEEEDSKLRAAIAEHGHCWSKVAACVPPRTDSQCRRRWKVLLPHEVPLLQAFRKMQKAALISNFVDREVERPALAGDFTPPLLIESVPESQEVHSGTENKKMRSTTTHNGRGSLSGSIPKLRSRRARKITHTDKVLKLTDVEDVENIDCQSNAADNVRINTKVRPMKNKPSASFGDTGFLDSDNCKEDGAFEGNNDVAMKKAAGRRKWKHGGSKEPKEIISMKKTARPCLEVVERTDEDVEAHGDDRVLLLEDIHPVCATPDNIMDGLDFNASGGTQANRSRKKRKMLSKPVNEAEEDDGDMTLASFLQRSGKCPSKSSSRKANGSRSSTSMSSKKATTEMQEEDEWTLASFYSNVKKQKLERGTRG